MVYGTVPVAHPIPVRWVPRRGRYERLSFRTGTVRAGIRRARRAEIGAGETIVGSGPRLHAFDGALWRPLGPIDSLVAGLGDPGRLVPIGTGDWWGLLERTPLQADITLALNAAEWDRPDPFPAGRLVEDLGEEAAAAARRFVETDILDVEGEAYLRVAAPALFGAGDRHVVPAPPPRHPLGVEIDRVADHDRLLARLGIAAPAAGAAIGRVRDRTLALLPDAFAGDDVVRTANALPQMLLQELRTWTGAGRLDPAVPAGLAGEVLAATARGSVGLIRRDEVEEVAALGLRVLDALPPRPAPEDPGQTDIHWVRPYVEEVVRPWAARFRPLPDEDAASLGGLGA